MLSSTGCFRRTRLTFGPLDLAVTRRRSRSLTNGWESELRSVCRQFAAPETKLHLASPRWCATATLANWRSPPRACGTPRPVSVSSIDIVVGDKEPSDLNRVPSRSETTPRTWGGSRLASGQSTVTPEIVSQPAGGVTSPNPRRLWFGATSGCGSTARIECRDQMPTRGRSAVQLQVAQFIKAQEANGPVRSLLPRLANVQLTSSHCEMHCDR